MAPDAAVTTSRRDTAEPRIDGRAWFWAGAIILLVAIDVPGLTVSSGNSRLLLILIPIYFTVIPRTWDRRVQIPRLLVPEWILLVFVGFGLTGSMYARFVTGSADTSLVIFATLLLGFLHLVNAWRITEQQAARYLWFVLVVAVLGFAIHTLAIHGLIPNAVNGDPLQGAGIGERVFSHERAFLLSTAVVAAIVMRRWILTGLLVVAGVTIFQAYPAATYLAVAGFVALGQWWLSERRGSHLRTLGAVVLLVVVAVNVVNVATAGPAGEAPLVGSYFERVGKSDNTEARSTLWGGAWKEIESSPWIGSAFTDDLTLHVRLSGNELERPPHNDFLQVAMGGGVVALGLMVSWLVTAHVVARKAFRRMPTGSQEAGRRLMRICLACLDGFVGAAIFNPTMSKLGLLVVPTLAFGCLMALSRSAPAVTDGPVPAG